MQVNINVNVTVECVGDVGMRVTIVRGKGHKMASKQVPPITMSDVQSVQLSLAPTLPDGSKDTGPFHWESSDPAIGLIVGDQVDGAGVHSPNLADANPSGPVAWLLTPSGPGTVTVTASSDTPNVDANSIDITLTEARSGSVNLSAGTPVNE